MLYSRSLLVELIYKTETDSENELMVTRGGGSGGGGRDTLGVRDRYVHTAVFKMGNRQGVSLFLVVKNRRG